MTKIEDAVKEAAKRSALPIVPTFLGRPSSEFAQSGDYDAAARALKALYPDRMIDFILLQENTYLTAEIERAIQKESKRR